MTNKASNFELDTTQLIDTDNSAVLGQLISRARENGITLLMEAGQPRAIVLPFDLPSVVSQYLDTQSTIADSDVNSNLDA